jgi:hypothetical protein
MPDWQRRRILIWGKTRPELSKTHREIVCTGGVFEDTRSLVRLYPIPLRYMDDEKYFAQYQWIEADVHRNPNDSRPESYKIRPDTIEVLSKIETGKGGDWSQRAEWIMAPQNVFSSVETLRARQEADRTSLGLVHPRKVLKISSQIIGAAEKAHFIEDYNEALKQMELPVDVVTGREVKPLTPPDFRYLVKFECDDDDCTGHEMSVLDWGTDALYWRMKVKFKNNNTAASKVVDKLQSLADTTDLHFFLGNIHNYPQNFTIVGLWAGKRQSQTSLF